MELEEINKKLYASLQHEVANLAFQNDYDYSIVEMLESFAVYLQDKVGGEKDLAFSKLMKLLHTKPSEEVLATFLSMNVVYHTIEYFKMYLSYLRKPYFMDFVTIYLMEAKGYHNTESFRMIVECIKNEIEKYPGATNLQLHRLCSENPVFQSQQYYDVLFEYVDDAEECKKRIEEMIKYYKENRLTQWNLQ